MTVRLHIDRLVLDGLDLPPGGHHALRAAVEGELARLIAAGGLAPALKDSLAVPSIDAPSIDAGGSPRQLGAAIAGAVYAGVGDGRR